MRKYMKYEIKGSYKFILGIIAIVLICSSIIQFNLYPNINSGSGNIEGLTALVAILVIFGAFLTAFFQIIGSFKKELYEDRGYLTFSLPLTGNKILGAKMIVALVWFAVLGISIVLYNLFLTRIIYRENWSNIINFIKEPIRLIIPNVLSVGIVAGLSAIMTLILIYFSMALGRVSVKNKKVGGLWFVIFIVLNTLSNYFMYAISRAIPYYMSVKNFKIFQGYKLYSLSAFNSITEGQMIIFGNNFDAYINLSTVLLTILIGIGAFLATGYIIEKKIDL